MKLRRPTLFYILGIGLLFLSPLVLLVSNDSTFQKPAFTERFAQIEFKANFLEAARQKPAPSRGDEIAFGPIRWLSSTYGIVVASMWQVFASVTFETTENRKEIKNIRIDPAELKIPGNSWNLWRHRHGYSFIPGQGYFWSSLEGTRPMDSDTGLFYDRFLKDVWGFWVKKRLKTYLSDGDTAIGADWSSEKEEASDSILKKEIRLATTEKELAEPVPMVFQINMWRVPVKIDFKLVPDPQKSSGFMVKLANGSRWKFDMGEWRRRHGYQKTFWTGYQWDPEFPRTQELTQEQGRQLDELLEKAVAYWVDVSVQQMAWRVDFELGRAMKESKNPSDALPGRPALQ